MNKKTIYVVMGSTGEYSDRTEWTVAAYDNKEVAEQHVIVATNEAEKIRDKVGNDWYREEKYGKNKYDPHMSLDYTGAHYYWEKVDLIDVKTLDEFDKYWFVELI